MTHPVGKDIATRDWSNRGWVTFVIVLAVTGCGGFGTGARPEYGVGDGFRADALSACASAQDG